MTGSSVTEGSSSSVSSIAPFLFLLILLWTRSDFLSSVEILLTIRLFDLLFS